MGNMINIQNIGLLDLDFMKIMGVNVKEGEDSIGQFGTGLKYAIAVLLRERIDFKLFVGEHEYKFYTESKTLRGKTFDVCCMQGPYDFVELPFTTELGKNWEPWMAYREIVSNAFDECGWVGNSSGPTQGFTTFYIEEQEDFKDTFLRHKDLKCIYKGQDIDIYEGETNYIYNQGIRAYETCSDCKYTYDLKNGVCLTEDRTIAYEHQIRYALGTALVGMDDYDLLLDIMNCDGWWEEGLSIPSYVEEPTETFKKAYEDSDQQPYWALSTINKWAPEEEEPEMTTGEKAEKILDYIRDECEELDIHMECTQSGSKLSVIIDLEEEDF